MSTPPTRNDISRLAWDKFGSHLRAALDRHVTLEEPELPVIVRLASDAPRDEAADPAARAAAFDEEAGPLVDALTSHGARNVTALWIGRAVGADAPLAAVIAVALRPEASSVDLVTEHDALL